MATETMNYGYPKPGEDDFYDISQFNQALDMIDQDMKEMDEEKQNKLGIGTFKDNIDILGEGGLPWTNSVCWCRAKVLRGTLPYESQDDYWFTLETNTASENQASSERSQRAVVYGEDNIKIFERLFTGGEWCSWKELLRSDGDTKDNIVTFHSGDMESPTGWAEIAPVESGEKHSSLWRKFSLGIKNLRYLRKLLGATDISSIADGTLTGALSMLNTGINYENIKTRLPADRDGIEMYGYTERGMVVLKITVRGGAAGVYDFVIPKEFAARDELYFTVYSASDPTKAKAYITGNTVRVVLPENCTGTWMSIVYPLRVA